MAHVTQNDRDDVSFTSKLIDYVAANSCIDLNSVLVSGESNGAMVRLHLAVYRPDMNVGLILTFTLS